MKAGIISLLTVLPGMAVAAPNITTSHLQIQSYRCSAQGSRTSCRVMTTQDLGGTRYRLELSGDSHKISPLVRSFSFLKNQKIYVVAVVENSREGTGNWTEGELDSLILMPYND